MEENIIKSQLEQSPPKREKIHYAWLIVLSLGLIEFADIGIFANCAGVFIQPVCDELGFARADFSLYFSIVCLVMAATMPLAQKIMLRFNLSLVISCVILLECFAFGLMSQYKSVTGWYFSGVLLGVGQAYLTYLLVPFVLNNWFKIRYGIALGLSSCCSTLGGAIFSPITGQLIAHFGWRPAYLILAICALAVALPCTIIFLRISPEKIGKEAYGANTVRDNPILKEKNEVGFTLQEAVRSPYFYLCIVFTIGLTFAANFINQITPFAYTLGFPITLGSGIASMTLIAGVLGDLICGALTDRFSVKVGIASELIAGIVGMLLLIFSNAVILVVFIGAFMFGFALALLNTGPPLLTRLVMGPKHFGKIYSFIGVSITLTSSLAQWVYGKIYDVTGAYTFGLGLAISCLLVALITTFVADHAEKKLRPATIK